MESFLVNLPIGARFAGNQESANKRDMKVILNKFIGILRSILRDGGNDSDYTNKVNLLHDGGNDSTTPKKVNSNYREYISCTHQEKNENQDQKITGNVPQCNMCTAKGSEKSQTYSRRLFLVRS